LQSRSGAGRPLLPHRAAQRQRNIRSSQTDPPQGTGRSLARPGRQRKRAGQKTQRQGSSYAITHLETALRFQSGDDSLPRSYRAPASRRSEDPEFLWQVAASATEAAVTRNGRAAHHPAIAGIPKDRARRLPAPAGRQIAFPDRNPEVPKAAGSAASTPPPPPPPRPGPAAKTAAAASGHTTM